MMLCDFPTRKIFPANGWCCWMRRSVKSHCSSGRALDRVETEGFAMHGHTNVSVFTTRSDACLVQQHPRLLLRWRSMVHTMVVIAVLDLWWQLGIHRSRLLLVGRHTCLSHCGWPATASQQQQADRARKDRDGDRDMQPVVAGRIEDRAAKNRCNDRRDGICMTRDSAWITS